MLGGGIFLRPKGVMKMLLSRFEQTRREPERSDICEASAASPICGSDRSSDPPRNLPDYPLLFEETTMLAKILPDYQYILQNRLVPVETGGQFLIPKPDF